MGIFWPTALGYETTEMFEKKTSNYSTGYKWGASTWGLTLRSLKCQGRKFEPGFSTFSSLDKCVGTTLLISMFLVSIQKTKALKKERSWENGQLKIHFKLHTWAENSNQF